jgi:hypothetical protein
VAWLVYGRQIGADLPDDRLAILSDLCEGGWWWALPGISVMTERPRELHLDNEGRLHADSGPAIAYPDAWGVWAWHGVRVPREVIEDPPSLTPQQIDQERNAEVRRVMIERFGMERYIREAKATVLHADTDGLGQPRRLLHVPRRDDTPLVVVEVTNSTPEPDGSRHRFLLRVPPQMRTCQQAVAWTFGITGAEAQEFSPVAES